MERNSIDATIQKLNAKYGNKNLVKMGDIEKIKIEAIPTGIIALDYVFGCGGLPKGRITEIFGNESSGKSSLALFLAGVVQKQHGKVVWIDAEMAFDVDYAQKMGVTVKDLFVSQPATAEEALDTIDKMAQTGQIDLIVLDSVAALCAEKEHSGNIADQDMALVARLMSKSMRMIANNVSRTKTAVIMINQVRENIAQFFGRKERSTGGRALKFFSSIRLEVKKGKPIVKGTETIGNRMSFCAIKNKTAPPLKIGEVNLYYDKGVEDIYGNNASVSGKEDAGEEKTQEETSA